MYLKSQAIVSTLRGLLKNDHTWVSKLSDSSKNPFSLHLAILKEPYLTYIMEGKKTVETRFAKRPCPPYEKVNDGDVILLKKAGGKVAGICEVEKVWFYKLVPGSLEAIKKRFGFAICPENGQFWEERAQKTVATLMLVKNVAKVDGIKIEKRDRRGWVVLPQDRQMAISNL
jgi:ASC-1-like (ASCH) protein